MTHPALLESGRAFTDGHQAGLGVRRNKNKAKEMPVISRFLGIIIAIKSYCFI
jgi:hypothetical protein